MCKKLADLKFGAASENDMIPILNEIYNCNFKKTKGYCTFDFIDTEKKIIVELKTRRCEKNKYPDTMIGYNKILKCRSMTDQGYKCYFAFRFTDTVGYYDLDSGINEKWIRDGGRWDRGKAEKSTYVYIPVNKLEEKNLANNVDELADELQKIDI